MRLRIALDSFCSIRAQRRWRAALKRSGFSARCRRSLAARCSPFAFAHLA
jgi:hypothetical protein